MKSKYLSAWCLDLYYNLYMELDVRGVQDFCCHNIGRRYQKYELLIRIAEGLSHEDGNPLNTLDLFRCLMLHV